MEPLELTVTVIAIGSSCSFAGEEQTGKRFIYSSTTEVNHSAPLPHECQRITLRIETKYWDQHQIRETTAIFLLHEISGQVYWVWVISAKRGSCPEQCHLQTGVPEATPTSGLCTQAALPSPLSAGRDEGQPVPLSRSPLIRAVCSALPCIEQPLFSCRAAVG